MAEERKPFKDTKFYKFVTEKLAPIAGDVTGVVAKVATGNWTGAMQDVSDIFKERGRETADLQRLAMEWEKEKLSYSLEFAKLDQRNFELEIQDKANARELEIAKVKAGDKNYTQAVLAYTGVLSFIAIVFLVLAKGIQFKTQEEAFIIGSLTGLVGATYKDVYGYYFGSSRSSNTKQQTINEIAQKK
jgi:hypothetical protein